MSSSCAATPSFTLTSTDIDVNTDVIQQGVKYHPWRMHHCRRCGKIFCSMCCATKLALPRLAFVDPQRVCTDCIAQAKTEIELFERQLPVLLKGAEFHLGANSDEPLCRCKLDGKSLRNLEFTDVKESSKSVHEDVCLRDVTSIHLLTNPLNPSPDGKAHLVGINLSYMACNASSSVQLSVPLETVNKSKSISFLRNLQKAMKMIFDSSS